jgi:transposase
MKHQETTGHRDNPLFRIRRLLRRRLDRLCPYAWTRLLTGLKTGDRDAQIGRTWTAAQGLRRIASTRSGTVSEPSSGCTAGLTY